MPRPKYISFPSPPKGLVQGGVTLSPQEWAQAMLDKVVMDPLSDGGEMQTVFGEKTTILDLGRRSIALFNDFPPEYVDYYKALQVEIASRIPEEQNRPLICLAIKGSARLGDTSPADIGMAGGTGPLSDATILENLMLNMSGHKGGALNNQTRESVAARMQNFSGVMYSMPPPRDFYHVRDAPAYLGLYNSARRQMPCSSLHILTNTGHTNKSVFNNRCLMGRKIYGDVDDMTVKVANRIKREATRGERVLVLGTTDAAEKKLYPNLLTNRDLKSFLPIGSYRRTDAQTYLQRIIDQVKADKIEEFMPGEKRTCGEAFIDFVVTQAQNQVTTTLLFSCTELPMLLHAKVPGTQHTYKDILKLEFESRNLPWKYHDTEEMFVNEISNKSFLLQDHPEIRSTMVLGRGGLSPYHALHAKLDVIKEEMIAHCHTFDKTNDEVQIQKRDVLMAALQFFEDGDGARLRQVLADNPRYDEATLNSKTQRLVAKGLKVAALIEIEKSKMESFAGFKNQVQDQRAPVSANSEEKIADVDEAPRRSLGG